MKHAAVSTIVALCSSLEATDAWRSGCQLSASPVLESDKSARQTMIVSEAKPVRDVIALQGSSASRCSIKSRSRRLQKRPITGQAWRRGHRMRPIARVYADTMSAYRPCPHAPLLDLEDLQIPEPKRVMGSWGFTSGAMPTRLNRTTDLQQHSPTSTTPQRWHDSPRTPNPNASSGA